MAISDKIIITVSGTDKVGIVASVASALTRLNVNIEDKLRESSPQVRINKKCDSYRVVNNNGLKVTISFENLYLYLYHQR